MTPQFPHSHNKVDKTAKLWDWEDFPRDESNNKLWTIMKAKHMDRKARQSSIFLSYSPMTANNCTHPTSLSRVYVLVTFSNILAKTVAQGAGKPAIYFDKIDIQSFRKISPETRHIFPLSKWILERIRYSAVSSKFLTLFVELIWFIID